ncbi:MAG: Glu-tRNA(Gln) amidotransferase GatDE subunit E, partial [Candidatus Bathyarchaeia archaeon]
ANPIDAVKELGLTIISEEELCRIIDGYIEKSERLVLEKGLGAINILMGAIMRDFRGRIKPEIVSKVLKEKISRRITT